MSQSVGKPVSKPAQPSGLRVLVVDDEKALADLVASYLTLDGFEVSMAHDGQQAIDQAREVDPEVIVLDLGLPVLDGVEVCRVVRTFSDCYIIMLTARTDEVDKLVGLSVGADDYLTKPFSPRELLARIHAMLRCASTPQPHRHSGGADRSAGEDHLGSGRQSLQQVELPAEHLPHVFERFYRVDTARDRTHGGSGIGLAIAKALVQAHGGQITATSPGTGQGSTFWILLPRG